MLFPPLFKLLLTPAPDAVVVGILMLYLAVVPPEYLLARTAPSYVPLFCVMLVSLGVKHLASRESERFEEAKQIFRARAELNSDDALQLLGAGKFYLLTGDPVSAARVLQNSLKLDPGIPAKYFLAYAKAQQGNVEEAKQILETIPQRDAQYANARALLKILAAR